MAMIKRKRRELSEREKRLVQLLIDGCGIDGHGFTRAMLQAGYPRTTACTQSKRTRSKPAIQRALIEARIAKGLYVTPEERALVGKV